ncbi:hypothetical protein SFRURICE_018878 [Spodoptera frugiperda]|nr:hypothetical protein SFRURICE_018878 [Spodoptera frugiperda]
MAKLGDYGQAWRLWPSLATMAKLGDYGQTWRLWPSLSTIRIRHNIYDCTVGGWCGGWATGCRATGSGFDSRTEQLFV